MKFKTRQKNEPVLDTTRIVFNRRMTLWEKIIGFFREVFR